MTDVIRTADERFADLPESLFAALYTESDGLRLAHVGRGRRVAGGASVRRADMAFASKAGPAPSP